MHAVSLAIHVPMGSIINGSVCRETGINEFKNKKDDMESTRGNFRGL